MALHSEQVKAPAATGNGAVVVIAQLENKSYSYNHAGSATAVLKGSTEKGAPASVSEDIVALSEDAQGSIPAHINQVWISVTSGVMDSAAKCKVVGWER